MGDILEHQYLTVTQQYRIVLLHHHHHFQYLVIMSEKLEIFQKPIFDDNIVREAKHTYYTQTNSFSYNDETEIIINQQDLLIDFNNGYFYLECEFKLSNNVGEDGECTLSNNVGAHLFESITYELNGKEIDKVLEPGVLSTIRTYLCYTPDEAVTLGGAGWNPFGESIPMLHTDKTFTLRIPLKLLFSIIQDYNRVVTGKHKFRLMRARNDSNCYVTTDTKTAEINIQKLELKVKHIHLRDDKVTSIE